MTSNPDTVKRSWRTWLVGMSRVVVVVGSAAIVVGALLPWVISGETTRNSFTTVRTARSLDLIDNATVNFLLAGWFLVPVVAAVVALLALFGRRRSLAFVAGGLGVISTLFAGFVRLSPIETATGPLVTLGAGLVVLLATIGLVVGRDHPRLGTDEPMVPTDGSPVP